MYGNPYPTSYPGVYQTYPGGPSQSGAQQSGQPQGGSQNAGYVCRPVTSREEAVASQVDFLGPGTIMPDFAHGMIYFKRFNPNSGSAEFYDFSVQAAPQAQVQQPTQTPPPYDPKVDIEGLKGECSALREDLEKLKKATQKRTTAKEGDA